MKAGSRRIFTVPSLSFVEMRESSGSSYYGFFFFSWGFFSFFFLYKYLTCAVAALAFRISRCGAPLPLKEPITRVPSQPQQSSKPPIQFYPQKKRPPALHPYHVVFCFFSRHFLVPSNLRPFFPVPPPSDHRFPPLEFRRRANTVHLMVWSKEAPKTARKASFLPNENSSPLSQLLKWIDRIFPSPRFSASRHSGLTNNALISLCQVSITFLPSSIWEAGLALFCTIFRYDFHSSPI